MPQLAQEEKIRKRDRPSTGDWNPESWIQYLPKYQPFYSESPITVRFSQISSAKEYYFSENFSFDMESKFESLAESILESSKLLLLGDDWDDEGAVKIEEATLIQAIKFLIRYAEWVEEKSSIIIKSPIIGPLTDGSVDLYWTHEKVDFVINVPAFPNQLASFYGDNQEDLYIEGKFNIKNDNPGILLTMINLCQ
jgi:hypothetical protein